jgi:DNA sulfur modification protein DndB
MDPVQTLSHLITSNKSSSHVEFRVKRSRTFGQTTLSTTMPMNKLFMIYDVDLEVQRNIIPQNLSKLIDYITLHLEHGQSIYFPGVLLSARGAGEYDEAEEVFRLSPMEKCYVVDGQHRLAAFRRVMETLQSNMARAKDRREYDRVEELTEKLRRIYEFPMSVMIYLDIDAKQERQLFSDINKLPRKIGGNLAALRDQRRFYHALASRLIEEAPVMRDIPVDLYTERGKSPEYLFSYNLLTEILVGLFEGRLKSAARNNGYYFGEQEFEEHFQQATIYFLMLRQYLPSPSRDQISWSENLQLALALFFHNEAFKTLKFNKYTLEHAMKILPHVKWDSIFRGDEVDRLPRRSRIMKAYQFVNQFYQEQQLFLIRDKEDAS